MFEIFGLSKKKKELEDKITELEARENALNEEIDNLRHQTDDNQTKANNAEIAAKEAQATLDALNGRIAVIESMNDYNIPYYQDSLDELESKRYEMQSRLEHLVSNGLWRIEQECTVDGSSARGREIQSAYGNGLVFAITSYINTKERTITSDNIAKSKELIKNKFNSYQNKANKLRIALNSEYPRIRMDMMDINLAIKIKQKEEKVRIREEKRRLKEQEQLLADIAKERERLENERKAINLAFAKAMTDKERAEIKEKMANIDKRLDSIAYRESHSKAGWLYVISSPSLPGMVKIGCTRRLVPMVRVKELSSSSLPEPFKAHCFVFSDDCFELESNMHKFFDDKRVAPDREFFYTTPKKAIEVLREMFNADVHFVNDDDEMEDEYETD